MNMEMTSLSGGNKGVRVEILLSHIIYSVSTFFLTMSLFAVEFSGFNAYFSLIYVFDVHVLLHYLSRVSLPIKKRDAKVSRLWIVCFTLIAFAFLHTWFSTNLAKAVFMLVKLSVFIYGYYYYSYKIRIMKNPFFFFLLGTAVNVCFALYQQLSFGYFAGKLPYSDPRNFIFVLSQGNNIAAWPNDFMIPFLNKIAATFVTKFNLFTTAGLTPEPSYFAAILIPLILLLSNSWKLKSLILVAYFFTMSRSAFGTLLYLAFFFIARKIWIRNRYFFVAVPVTVALLMSSYVMKHSLPSSTFEGRFLTYYAYLFTLDPWEKFVGIGYINQIERFGVKFTINKEVPIWEGAYTPVPVKPMTSFGGIMVELGIVGLLLYLLFFAELLRRSARQSVIVAMMICFFNYFYFTTWPVYTFYAAWALYGIPKWQDLRKRKEIFLNRANPALLNAKT